MEKSWRYFGFLVVWIFMFLGLCVVSCRAFGSFSERWGGRVGPLHAKRWRLERLTNFKIALLFSCPFFPEQPLEKPLKHHSKTT